MKIPSPIRLFAFSCAALSAMLTGCQPSEPGTFLGSAVVEVETYQVPSLVQGPLTKVVKQEGDSVSNGEEIALVDTVPFALQYAEASAGRPQLDASYAAQTNQIASMQAETKGLDKESDRILPI